MKYTLDAIFEYVWEDMGYCEDCEYFDCITEPHGERTCECTADNARKCQGVDEIMHTLIDEWRPL